MAFCVDFLFNASEKSIFRDFAYIYPFGSYAPALALPDWIAYLTMFFVTNSNLMPVLLYATMELCNMCYALFSPTTRHGPRDRGRGSLGARAGDYLCYELGQVSHIFFDKTGTLTKIIMCMEKVLRRLGAVSRRCRACRLLVGALPAQAMVGDRYGSPSLIDGPFGVRAGSFPLVLSAPGHCRRPWVWQGFLLLGVPFRPFVPLRTVPALEAHKRAGRRAHS